MRWFEDTAKAKDSLFFFIAAALSILVPTPGRFAFGFIVLVLFNLHVIISLLFERLLRLLKLDALKNVLMLSEIISLTVLFKQLLMLICPIAALTLGFIIYLPACSSTLISLLFIQTKPLLKDDLRKKLLLTGSFSLIALFFFFVRDALGYGTLTFIAHKTIVALPLFSSGETMFSFLATIPGAFVLLALFFALYLFVSDTLLRVHRSVA